MSDNIINSTVVGRFAPSPTGRMHLGNVWCALLSWLSARSQGGRWIVRIEDLDPQRSKPELAWQLLRDLETLGLDWDGEIVWQSQRRDIYEAALAKLPTYPCYCTRADLLAASAPHPTDGHRIYSGRCRPQDCQGGGLTRTTDALAHHQLQQRRAEAPVHLGNDAAPAKGRRPALRLYVEKGIQLTFNDKLCGPQTGDAAVEWGDFILRRADGVHAYQLAVTVDDAMQGVTEIVRGRDLLTSTYAQLYLGRLLNFAQPIYVHVPMLVNDASQRLSKRDGALALDALLERHTPADIIGRLAYHADLIPEPAPVTPAELLPHFSFQPLPATITM